MSDPIIRIKRSAVEGKIPTSDQLPLGEIALNTFDGKVYASKNVGIGTTVFVVNPWTVGTGTDTYNTYFTVGNVGIGSTLPSSKLDVNGDVNISGVVTAASFIGSGINLTGIVTQIVAGTNVTIDPVGGTGSVTINASGTGGGGETYWTSTSAGIHTLSNVGIGTTNPTTELFLDGVIGFVNSNIRIGNDQTLPSATGSSNISIGDFAGNPTSSGTRNVFIGDYANAFGLNGSYNVMVGYKGSTQGSHNIHIGEYHAGGGGNYNVVIGSGDAANNYYFGVPDASKDYQFAIGINTTSNNPADSQYWIIGNEQFNIGIGTINPTSKLHVVGSANVVGTVTAISFIKSGGTSSEFLKADGSVDSNAYATETYVGLATVGLASEIYVNTQVGLSTVGLLSQSGDGSNLTGIVTSIVAGTNITISGSTGQVTINASGGGGGGSSSQWVTTDVGIHTLSNVGIGTTNPTEALTVKGTSFLENLTVSGISTFAGNVFIGDNTADSITVTGEFVSNLVPDASNTYDLGTTTQRWRDLWIAGNIAASGTIGGIFKNYSETVYAFGNTGATPTFAFSNGNFVTATLSENITSMTFDLTGVPSGAFSFTLVLSNDATAGRTITWPASVKWPNATVPVRTTTASKTDVYTFFTYDSGTTWWGNLSLYNFS